MDDVEEYEASPSTLVRIGRAATVILIVAAVFALGMFVGVISEGNAETFAVFSKKECDQARYAASSTLSQPTPDSVHATASEASAASDGPTADPNQLDGVDAWPANNKIVWSTSVAPSAEVGTVVIHNGSDSDNRQLLFRLNGDHGPQLAARLYISASADAQITLPTGDYQIDLISTPRGLPWKEVLKILPKPAFRATLEANDPDDARKITIPAIPGPSTPAKNHKAVKPKPAEPKDYGSLGPPNQNQM